MRLISREWLNVEWVLFAATIAFVEKLYFAYLIACLFVSSLIINQLNLLYLFMKKIYCLILFAFISVKGFSQSAANEPKIKAAIVNFYNGLSSLDDAAIGAAVTNDFTLVEHKKIWNTDSLLKALAPMKGTGVKRVNKQEYTKIEQNGNVAWAVYYNTADITRGDKTRSFKWLESALLVKDGGKWKLKLLHVTDL
ncbi:ketosteroid isomerase-like protein [Mucilaginibacter sp. UYP25]